MRIGHKGSIWFEIDDLTVIISLLILLMGMAILLGS